MQGYVSPWMDEDLAIFRDAAARFLESEMVPYDGEWRKQQNVGREIWRKAGATGLLCTYVSADYGGAGGDFRHEAVLYEELARRLNELGGGQETKASIANKLSRGQFSAIFFVDTLRAIGIEQVDLGDI